MKASKFSDAQKAFLLNQGADGVPVTDICRKAGISQATQACSRSYLRLRPTPNGYSETISIERGGHQRSLTTSRQTHTHTFERRGYSRPSRSYRTCNALTLCAE